MQVAGQNGPSGEKRQSCTLALLCSALLCSALLALSGGVLKGRDYSEEHPLDSRFDIIQLF